MIYWAITVQGDDFIGVVYLTTSYKRAEKKLDELEEKSNGRYYYLNPIRLGQERVLCE